MNKRPILCVLTAVAFFFAAAYTVVSLFTTTSGPVPKLVFVAVWMPYVVLAGIFAVLVPFRRPIVIRLEPPLPPPPLPARFLEQEQRLERRERLKRQLRDVNVEIETFAAAMTPDDRDAWAKRPGPYGK